MAETSIVRIRRQQGQVVQSCEVYIGRQQTQGGWNLSASKWANPFKAPKDGSIEEVLAKYEHYVRTSGLINQLNELRGKQLGCWCKPSPCHGDVLIKLIKEMDESVRQLTLQIAAADGKLKVNNQVVTLPASTGMIAASSIEPVRKYETTKTDFDQFSSETNGNLIYGLSLQGKVLVVTEGKWADRDIFRQSNLYLILSKLTDVPPAFIVQGVSVYLNGQGHYMTPRLVDVLILNSDASGIIKWAAAMTSDYDFVIEEPSSTKSKVLTLDRYLTYNTGIARAIL